MQIELSILLVLAGASIAMVGFMEYFIRRRPRISTMDKIIYGVFAGSTLGTFLAFVFIALFILFKIAMYFVWHN